MMAINAAGVLLFALSAALVFAGTRSIYAIALCTFVVMTALCYLGQRHLQKSLGAGSGREVLLEAGCVAVFIFSVQFLPLLYAALVYTLAWGVYMYLHRGDIFTMIKGRRARA